jgi:hypothetical protein
MDTLPHIEIQAVSYRLPIIYSATRVGFELVGHDTTVNLFFEKSCGAEPLTSEPNLVLDAMNYVLRIQKNLSIYTRPCAAEKFDLQKWSFNQWNELNRLC